MIKLLGINLSILYFFEVALVFFLSLGFLPPYYSWIIVALAIYFFYKEPLQNCFYFFICSLPFFIAAPIFSFESLSLWRPLSALLILKYLSANWRPIFLKIYNFQKLKLQYFNKEILLLVIFGAIALSGIFFAKEKIAVIKTTLYYLNIFLVGFVAWKIIKNREIFKNVLRCFLINGVVILLAATLQELSVFFVSLNQFWEFWARGPILTYYGETLSKHLLVSNTWFSYWPGDFATLRAFSIFQDSHAFGLFLVLTLIPVIFLYLNFSQLNSFKALKFFDFNRLKAFIFIALFFIVLSGTRGLWIAFYFLLVPAIIIFTFYYKNKIMYDLGANFLKFAGAFTICFFLASGFWFLQIYTQNTTKTPADILLAFKRIKTSFDLNEISNKSRLEIWNRSIEAAIKSPIFGVGAGNFPVALEEKISNVKKGASAHNLYLQFLVENGLLGLLAIILLIYFIFKKAYCELNKKNIFALVFFVVFIWILGYNLFDVALLNDKILIAFTILTVLLYKSSILRQRRFSEVMSHKSN